MMARTSLKSKSRSPTPPFPLSDPFFFPTVCLSFILCTLAWLCCPGGSQLTKCRLHQTCTHRNQRLQESFPLFSSPATLCPCSYRGQVNISTFGPQMQLGLMIFVTSVLVCSRGNEACSWFWCRCCSYCFCCCCALQYTAL